MEFKHFKLLVLGLFGLNLLDLTQIDIDSILRKVYKELVILVEDPGVKVLPHEKQKMGRIDIKDVTDEDLYNL